MFTSDDMRVLIAATTMHKIPEKHKKYHVSGTANIEVVIFSDIVFEEISYSLERSLKMKEIIDPFGR